MQNADAKSNTSAGPVKSAAEIEHVRSDAPAAEYRQALVDFNNMRDDDTPEPISCGITCFIAEQNMGEAA